MQDRHKPRTAESNLTTVSHSSQLLVSRLPFALVLTGETRKYNPSAAACYGVVPEHPFSLAGGGWGAWEVAGRVSTIDLNDQLATATGIAGGRQTIYTAALNWYVNRNVRFMFDYLHGNVTKQVSPTNAADADARFDAFAMRTQIAF